MKRVRWDDSAVAKFLNILNYIKKDSPTNAKNVKKKILSLIKAIPANPMMYRADELKQNNDGTYRVLNRSSIRVSYKIETTHIVITRVRHSEQEPLLY